MIYCKKNYSIDLDYSTVQCNWILHEFSLVHTWIIIINNILILYHIKQTVSMCLRVCKVIQGCLEVIIEGIWGAQLSHAFIKMKLCKSPIKTKLGCMRHLGSARPQSCNRLLKMSKCGKEIWQTWLHFMCLFFFLTAFWSHLWYIMKQIDVNK